MDRYDPDAVPPAFGLNNTGAICFLNGFLQMLASCTALVKVVREREDYLRRTDTGRAMLAFFRAFDGGESRAERTERAELPLMSARVLDALVRDLAVRRPLVRFGGGQECASEALMHLIDMMEPPGDDAREAETGVAIRSINSPITELFLHRTQCDIFCRTCNGVVSTKNLYSVYFNAVELDRLYRSTTPPATPQAFAKALLRQVSRIDDYNCEVCKTRSQAFLDYRLVMVPEIIVCAFNLFEGHGGQRFLRYFPEAFVLAAKNGAAGHRFRLVAQVEHSGSVHGGHYWARCLRRDGGPPGGGARAFLLNDTGVAPSTLETTMNTFMIAYHYDGPQLST